MPSPIGHALAGVAGAWLIFPPGPHGLSALRHAAIFGAVAVAPDLDLVWGNHSAQTHGLGAALIAGLVAWTVVRLYRWDVPGWQAALAVAAAYASHTLLDWLGSDSSPPIGIMALWPLSRDYFEADLHVFMAISRRYWREGFWVQNLAAVAREIVILGPVVAAAVWMRGKQVARST
jgi:membrane-bound metal-dependent hydrolase YbcI (DUF457 family)